MRWCGIWQLAIDDVNNIGLSRAILYNDASQFDWSPCFGARPETTTIHEMHLCIYPQDFSVVPYCRKPPPTKATKATTGQEHVYNMSISFPPDICLYLGSLWWVIHTMSILKNPNVILKLVDPHSLHLFATLNSKQLPQKVTINMEGEKQMNRLDLTTLKSTRTPFILIK